MASTTTCIRCTDREAPRVKVATQTTPAKAKHNIVRARVVYKSPQQTDAEMSKHYNKRSTSPPTTSSITAIVIPKKSKKVRTKSGKANNKAAQRRSWVSHLNSKMKNITKRRKYQPHRRGVGTVKLQAEYLHLGARYSKIVPKSSTLQITPAGWLMYPINISE